MSTDPMMPAQDQPIPQRGTYIPHWGNKHEDLTKSVLRGGVPTGFQVGDILPEKRWAISSDTGEIMEQREFEPLYQKWQSIFCTQGGTLVPIAQVNRPYHPSFESCPNVHEFVMTTVDEDGKPCPVGREAHRNRPAAGPRVLYDSSGQNPRTALETLRIYKAPRAMKELTGIEKLKNILPEGQYQGEVDKVLSKHGLSVADLTAGLAASPDGFDRVPISEEDIKRLETMVAEEEGAKQEEVAEEASGAAKADLGATELPDAAEQEAFFAPCGQQCKSRAGVVAHARHCAKCASSLEGEAA